MEAGGIPVQVRYCESQIHEIFIYLRQPDTFTDIVCDTGLIQLCAGSVASRQRIFHCVKFGF